MYINNKSIEITLRLVCVFLYLCIYIVVFPKSTSFEEGRLFIIVVL